MRTVTFSDEKVGKLLNENFVSTWINRNPKFHDCSMDEERNIVTNSFECFATKNFCTFFVTPDREVLHYFSGYYSPTLFSKEVEFVQTISREILDDRARLKKGSLAQYRDLHRAHAAEHEDAAKALQKLKLGNSNGHKQKQAEYRARRESFVEGVRYLAKVHEALESRSKKGAPVDLAKVIRNYMGGNEFTEE